MTTMDYSILTRVFTRTVLNEYASKQTPYNEILISAFKHLRIHQNVYTNIDAFESLYDMLSKKYRNEYFYKNTLLNKLLLGVHSTRTTTALTELPIGKAKADFLLINGKAVVYEIKTELDNFDRLDEQILNYYKAFDHISIVTYEASMNKLIQKYSKTPVGLCVITKKGSISQIKAPDEDRTRLSYADIFSILRKVEYESIVKQYFGALPKCSAFDYYDNCFQKFREIDLDSAYNAALQQLKKRNKVCSEYFYNMPRSLKSLGYFSNFTPSQFVRLEKNLLLPFRR